MDKTINGLPKIIAVDFDGTLCENKWPDIGAPNKNLIDYLRDQKREGTKLILWTCRTNDNASNALSWCAGHGLFFDEVNANLPEVIKAFKGESRKIFAHEYIDDLASTAFKLPFIKGATI